MTGDGPIHAESRRLAATIDAVPSQPERRHDYCFVGAVAVVGRVPQPVPITVINSRLRPGRCAALA